MRKFRGLAKVDQVRFHAASCTEAYGAFKINRLRGRRLDAGSPSPPHSSPGRMHVRRSACSPIRPTIVRRPCALAWKLSNNIGLRLQVSIEKSERSFGVAGVEFRNEAPVL